MPFVNCIYRLQHWCSAIIKAKQKIFGHLRPPSELWVNLGPIFTISQCLIGFVPHTYWIHCCLFAGKLHRPSDKVTLHVIGGVLLHPPPPHWCCYWLSGSSQGNLHRTLKAAWNNEKHMLSRNELRRVFKTDDSEHQNEAVHLRTTAAQRPNFSKKKYLTNIFQGLCFNLPINICIVFQCFILFKKHAATWMVLNNV